MKRNGIKNYSLIGITSFLFSLFSLSDAFAQSENSKPGKGKIIAGVALMAGGAAVAIIGGKNIFEENGGAAFVAGIAMFGTGTVLTILGVHDRSKSKKEGTSENSLSDQKVLIEEPPLESQFFLGPTKRGAAAGLVLKW
jgi:hypothetical protein